MSGMAIAVQADLTTLAGQAQHYAAIRSRLRNDAPIKLAVARSIVPIAPPKRVRRNPLPLDMLAPPSWRFLLKYAAVRHGVSIKDIQGQRKPERVVDARHELCYLMRTHVRLSFPEIGRRIGGRDHSTIINSVRFLEARIEMKNATR